MENIKHVLRVSLSRKVQQNFRRRAVFEENWRLTTFVVFGFKNCTYYIILRATCRRSLAYARGVCVMCAWGWGLALKVLKEGMEHGKKESLS